MCFKGNDDLGTSSSFLRSVLDSLTEQIAVIDEGGKIEWVNEAWIAFSKENGGALEKTCPGVNYLQVCRQSAESGETEAQEAYAGIRDVIEKRRPLFHFEYPCHSPQEKRWFMMWIKPLEMDGPRKFVVQHQNITQRRSLEEQLLRSQRMQAIGQMTGGVSHDFNNLLAVMIGNAEALEDKVGWDQEAKYHIEEIKWAIDRGSSLTNRLLAFSRQQPLEPASTDVTGLVGSLSDILRRTLGETVELRIACASDLWPAMIDPRQLENALINLAVNARDAMPNGGTLMIESTNVTLDDSYADKHEEVTPGDYVEIVVSDTGTGIPSETLEKAFEPFFTTKEVGRGNGLGLSVVYGLLKQSGGHITIESRVGRGTTVRLYLPRSYEAATQGSADRDTVELARGSERILVVEDNPSVRRISADILRSHGYEVVEARNGTEAIRRLRNGKGFALLFTDVVLPGGMNGVEISEKAKRIQPGIRVLYTTGYAENPVVHEGQLQTEVNLVRKPYRRGELLARIRAILESDCS
ncbi:MAG: ATP-binding protein [Kiloniellales bacterium]|nr:ATP-binding protein [Kiloniellales bacterium]